MRVYISRCHLKWNPNKLAPSATSSEHPRSWVGRASFFHLSRKHKAKVINLNTFNISLQDNPFLLPFKTPWHPIQWYFKTVKKKPTRLVWRHLAQPCLGEETLWWCTCHQFTEHSSHKFIEIANWKELTIAATQHSSVSNIKNKF